MSQLRESGKGRWYGCLPLKTKGSWWHQVRVNAQAAARRKDFKSHHAQEQDSAETKGHHVATSLVFQRQLVKPSGVMAQHK